MEPQFSQIELLRDTVAAYLAALPDFEGVTVNTRKTGDIENTIKTEIGKIGVSAEVFIASAKPTQSQSASVVYDPLVIGLAVYEDVLLNQDPTTGTGKGAYFLIESALVAMKLWTPEDYSSPFLPDAAGPQHQRSKDYPLLFILTQDFTTTLQLAKRTD